MLKRLVVYEIHSFRGRNVISLSTERRILALLGPNGTGKTTLLTVLAFILGSVITIDGNWPDSYAEAVFADGTCLRRDVQGRNFINSQETSLNTYLEYTGNKVAFLKNHLDENLQNTFSDPVALLEYIDSIIRKQEDKGLAVSRAQEYRECKTEEEKSRIELVKIRSKYQKLKTQLNNMGNAKIGQENVRLARESYRDTVFSLDVSRYLLCCIEEAIAGLKSNDLSHESVLIEKMIAKDHESLSKTHRELEEIYSDLSICTNECAQVKKGSTALSNKLNQAELSKVQLQYSMQIIDFEQNHQCCVASSVQARIKCLEDFLLDNVNQNYQEELAHQENSLKQSALQLTELREEIETALSGLIPQLLIVQNESAKSYTIRIESEARKLELESQLSKLKGEINSVQDVITAIGSNQESTENLNDDEWLSQAFCMLKAKCPRILGIAHDFVHLGQKSKLSRTQLKKILNTILQNSKVLGVVVESDDDAILYSKQINSINGFRIEFLPRKLKSKKHTSACIPNDIKKACPTVFWLSELLVTDSKEESHLAQYVARDFLLVPDGETLSLIVDKLDTSKPICDFDGNLYGNANNFSEVSFGNGNSDKNYVAHAKAAVGTRFQNCLELEKNVGEMDNVIDSQSANSMLQEGLEYTLQTFVSALNDLKGRVEISIKELAHALDHINQIENPVSKSTIGVDRQEPQEFTSRIAHNIPSELEKLRAQYSKIMETNFDAVRSSLKSSLDKTLEDCRQLEEEQVISRETLREKHRLQLLLKSDAFRYEQYIETNKLRPQEMENALMKISRAIEELRKNQSILALEKNQLERSLLAIESRQYVESTISGIREAAEISDELDDIERLFTTKEKLLSHIEQLEVQKRRYETIVDEARNADELDVQYSKVLQKVNAAQSEHIEAKEQHKRIEQHFKRLHQQKLDRTTQFVKVISPLFEEVYKSLYTYSDESEARACLELVDETDVDQGVSISAFPANKPYTDVACLSAGEFTLVYLAFEIALALAQNKTYFLFDELDSPMDSHAVNSLARCVVQLSNRTDVVCNIFFATHQRRLFLSANQIIGLFKIHEATSIIVVEVKNIIHK